MNYKMMGRFIAQILSIEGLFMIPALCISLYCGETMAVKGFIYTLLMIAVLVVALFAICRGAPSAFYAKEGLVCVGISWIVLSILGCMPFYISREIPKYVDAFFEIVSGFTTTGASIVPNVEGLSKGILYWRSFSHWLGGMGVLVFLLAIVPSGEKGKGFTMHLLRAESPGPDVGKLVPKMRTTAAILYIIYIVLTIINIIFLVVGDMPLFEAVCTAFGTAGTGGGIKVARLLLLFKGLRRNIRQMLQPRKVEVVRNNGSVVDEKILANTNAYLAAYVVILFAVFVIISLDGFSIGTNFSAVLCTFNNIGPGMEAVGPMCNFSGYSDLSTLVLSWAMLAGRLEIFPILILFSRNTWKQR